MIRPLRTLVGVATPAYRLHLPTHLPMPLMPTSSLPRRRFNTLLLAAGLLASGCSRANEPDNADRVSLDTARAELESGRVVLIDIREPAEHATGVAAGARLLPMSQLRARLAEIPVNPGQPVLLICNTQNRTRATLKALREIGYGHVRYVHGGMSGWAQRGWPMVKPPG